MSASPLRLASSLRAGLTGLALGVAVVAAITLVSAAPAKASGKLGEIVRAFCLSAFQNELSQAGKTAPAGMASYACDCVADRINTGSSIEAARSDCRQATTRRYRI